MADDLLGHPVIPDGPAMTLKERRQQQRKLTDQLRGYYAPPGTGPEGETCKSCAHARPHQMANTYWKCDRVQPTRSTKTDIRLKSPACRGWERITDEQ